MKEKIVFTVNRVLPSGDIYSIDVTLLHANLTQTPISTYSFEQFDDQFVNFCAAATIESIRYFVRTK